MNLKEEIYLYANSTTQKCPTEIEIREKNSYWRLFPVVHRELWISPQIFEKIWNGPNSVIKGLGETDACRKPEVENLVVLSF